MVSNFATFFTEIMAVLLVLAFAPSKTNYVRSTLRAPAKLSPRALHSRGQIPVLHWLITATNMRVLSK
jgi:hypothetical protein